MLLEFLDGLIRNVRQLLLERIALVRGRLLQIGFYLFLLVDEGIARSEVRFQTLELGLGFFSFFYLFLGSAPLLGDDILEVEIDLRFLAGLHSALDLVGRLFVIRRREYNKDGVNASAQIGKLYLPALSVLVSCFAPWSLTLRMTTSAQGFPFTSRIVPPIEPVWAAARGASTLVSMPIRMAASAQDLRKLFMLHSPFSRGSPTRCIRARCAPLSLSSGPIPSSAPGSNGSAVRNGVWRAGFGKGAQPQQAAIACTAGSIFVLVARPS